MYDPEAVFGDSSSSTMASLLGNIWMSGVELLADCTLGLMDIVLDAALFESMAPVPSEERSFIDSRLRNVSGVVRPPMGEYGMIGGCRPCCEVTSTESIVRWDGNEDGEVGVLGAEGRV